MQPHFEAARFTMLHGPLELCAAAALVSTEAAAPPATDLEEEDDLDRDTIPSPPPFL